MFDPSLFTDVLSKLPELNTRLSNKYWPSYSLSDNQDGIILTADLISSFVKQWIANFDAICDHKIQRVEMERIKNDSLLKDVCLRKNEGNEENE